jgi:hypothetical protein
VERSPFELVLLRAETRGAALQAARRIDPKISDDQIVPAEQALFFLYNWGSTKTGTRTLHLRATIGGATVW